MVRCCAGTLKALEMVLNLCPGLTQCNLIMDIDIDSLDLMTLFVGLVHTVNSQTLYAYGPFLNYVQAIKCPTGGLQSSSRDDAR